MTELQERSEAFYRAPTPELDQSESVTSHQRDTAEPLRLEGDHSSGTSRGEEQLTQAFQEHASEFLRSLVYLLNQDWLPGLLGIPRLFRYKGDVELSEIRYRVFRDLEDEPVEAGVAHPAEEKLLQAQRAYPQQFGSILYDWWRELDAENRCTLLQCVSRLPVHTFQGVGCTMAQEALESQQLSLRAAGVKVLERWGDSISLSLLRSYDEPDEWLADYISRVLREAS